MKVGISRSLHARVLALAAADPAREVCGLLLGDIPEEMAGDAAAGQGRIIDILPAANVAADPARHFELDPAVLLAAHRRARTGGGAEQRAGRVIGHYHSHPAGTATPSVTDAAMADGDGALWLIVAAGTTRLWRSVEVGAEAGPHDRFIPVELVDIDAAPDH